MRRNSFGVLFFLKKNQLLKSGDAPVSMRITVNGQREEIRTKKSINPSLWNQAKECSRGRDRKSHDLNNYIESAQIRLSQLFNEMEQNGKTITAKILRNKFLGMDDEDRKTLIAFFNEHNEQCRKLIGIDYADITVRRYECCSRYLQELIQKKHGEDDLLLREVKGELVRDFEFFMKTEKKWNKGGRPPKNDPAKNCVMVRFSDQEYAQFLSMFEESGVYAKAIFIKARVFKQPFRVVKTDKGAIEYISKLTQLYAQFRAIGVNYNQIVKLLHTHYSEKAALSMLYKLEKITIELVTTNQQIMELSQRFELEYLKRG